MQKFILTFISLILLVVGAEAAAKKHHAFLRPAYNPVVGGRQLSRVEIAEAIRTGDKYFPGAADALVRDLRQAGLPVTDRNSLAQLLRSDAVIEESCDRVVGEDGMIQTVWFEDGGSTGPFRRACYPGETVFTWRGKGFMSSRCGQPIVDERQPPTRTTTTTTTIPQGSPVQPPTEPCVELHSFYRVKVVFPTIEDRAAWFACNPQADCVADCLDWVSGRNARPFPRHGSDAARSQAQASRVRELTGQGSRGGHAALEGATHMPVTRHGPTVFCEKGTHNYWVLWPDSRVTKGLD